MPSYVAYAVFSKTYMWFIGSHKNERPGGEFRETKNLRTYCTEKFGKQGPQHHIPIARCERPNTVGRNVARTGAWLIRKGQHKKNQHEVKLGRRIN